MSVNFIFFCLFIYFLQGRSENHFCENAPCLEIIIIYYFPVLKGNLHSYQNITLNRRIQYL